MSDEGLPLGEAIRVYGDPTLVAAHESAQAKLRGIPPGPEWLHSPREWRYSWDRYQKAERAANANLNEAWEALVHDFVSKLRRGDLVATGFKVPVDEHSKPMLIPADLWSVLRPDFEASSVRAPGFTLIGVRVHKAPLLAISDTDQVEQGGSPLKRHFEAKLEQRARDNALCETQAKEFTWLATWATEEQKQGRLPRHRVPKPRSIREAACQALSRTQRDESMR